MLDESILNSSEEIPEHQVSSAAERDVKKHLRRNVSALITDSASFGMAMGFMGYTTVLPSLALALTHSEPLVGLATTLFAGMWLLPQLPIGRWMAPRPRKKPILVTSAIIGRTSILLFALALALQLSPAILFGLFLLMIIIFRGGDAISAVAWFDVISTTLPNNLRGRVLGAAQASAFVLQFGASFVVAWALGSTGPQFPVNYALLFGIAALGVSISTIALTFLIEPQADVSENVSAQLNMREHVKHILKSDRAFRQISIARVLIGLNALATPFYVVHATQYLNVTKDSIGLFLAAQTIGGVFSSFILGAINERRGSTIVVRLSMILAMVPPILAVVLHLIGVGNANLATIGYLLVFAAIGATDASFLLGFLTFVLDIAPPIERTAYTGLANTIGGLLVIAPTIGGFVLQYTSYPALFIAAGIGPLIGLWLALKLPRVKSNE
jgi:MFS family permease